MTRALTFVILLVVVGLFATLNWTAFTTPTALDLGLTTVQAPLGAIMLGLVIFLGVLFAGWVIGLQAGALAAARRQGKELQAQRDLADKAEASRFTELRAELVARLDRLQAESHTALEEGVNAIAAQLGHLDDRLDRARLPGPR